MGTLGPRTRRAGVVGGGFRGFWDHANALARSDLTQKALVVPNSVVRCGSGVRSRRIEFVSPLSTRICGRRARTRAKPWRSSDSATTAARTTTGWFCPPVLSACRKSDPAFRHGYAVDVHAPGLNRGDPRTRQHLRRVAPLPRFALQGAPTASRTTADRHGYAVDVHAHGQNRGDRRIRPQLRRVPPLTGFAL
jgi:hypothetical protein